ncbi:FHA domain-containing protein [Streptomyces sp. AJS327]|uniref:FHA domain-containing protein n=1 Tax=Streptomyces sp. AJS327 TaxID=2545265 RepID=UPI0015E023B8|nr:FHA domain-containing protein [Streptomyces sp. AJS327]MBA0054258.1 FHA domain-containing protein [Streptomyces sp. AJS327]
MYSIIVVPESGGALEGQFRLAPGETLGFGRMPAVSPLTRGSGGSLTLGHRAIPRSAGLITATGAFWTLTNLSRDLTYLVENPESPGEHVRIAPGRADAPVPFEFSRVVLPAANQRLTFDVWAPRHDYLEGPDDAEPAGVAPAATPAFPLDRDKRYFLVLAALCEPRLRDHPTAPPPSVKEVVRRLRPLWPGISRAGVEWNLDYLAVKVGLRPAPGGAEDDRGRQGLAETLAALALRFELVTEDDLEVLNPSLVPL